MTSTPGSPRAQHPPTRRGFLRWAITNRIVHGLTLTRPVARSSPSISEDERLEHLRRVLLDDTLVLSHRLLAVLVLLFGQPVSRILKLRVDDVTLNDTRALLRLGDDPVEVPEPAATLLRAYLADPRHRANTAAHTHSQTRGCCPGSCPAGPDTPPAPPRPCMTSASRPGPHGPAPGFTSSARRRPRSWPTPWASAHRPR